MIDDISIIEDILGKMVEYGDYLSVSYFICSHEMTKNKACKHLYGYADGICEVSYSETTGYLWTNQELNVGGHDLVAELVSYKDKYIILTIEFNKCEPEK
ncbi:hypothetical protein KAR91_18305 [Candidatus Pacearchaeota archaeon]|nr:hypothetical protein [Candidatus Pacearchaeota archaeon]